MWGQSSVILDSWFLYYTLAILFQHSRAYSGGIDISEGYSYTHKHRIKYTKSIIMNKMIDHKLI